MVCEAVNGLGGMHIAVNNAGINRNSAAEETPEGEWDMTFAVNTKGVFLSCQVRQGGPSLSKSQLFMAML